MSDIPLSHVHRAPDRQSDGPEPAVFVLHGRGADERDLLPIADRLPDEYHVLSLRAPDRLQGGYTWYELDLSGGGLHESQPDAGDFERSLELVRDSIAAAEDQFDLDPERLALLGFSQGAITSLALLVEDSGRYDWVAAMHGYLAASHASRDADLGGTPVFVSAGTGDRVIPASRAETAADRLAEMGADVTYETFPAGHGVGTDELEALVRFVEAQS